MSRVSERLFGVTPDNDWMPVVAQAIERLDLLNAAQPSDDLYEILTILRSLFAPPKCRMCGAPIDVARSYYGQGAVFCSTECREECLSL